MIWKRCLIGVLLFAALLLAMSSRWSRSPGPARSLARDGSPPAPTPPPPAATEPAMAAPAPLPAVGPDLFESTNILAFTLHLDSAALDSLRSEPRGWVKGRLECGSDSFPEVGVHIKGSQGSLQGIDARPALTVSFTKYAKGRKFQNIGKIHFNNSAEDPSLLTEIVCSELCRRAGLPAARSTYATLKLNRRSLGLYVLKEGLTKDFLKQYFSKASGNFYDGGFRLDIDQALERIGGNGPDDQSDRIALLAAARESNPKRRWDRLKEVLDTERFISLLAMTTLMWNWDGYPMARNNYRIYHDPETDKMVFIPHGLDQMFWEPEGTIYPHFHGIVAAAVMRVPEARSQYRSRLAELNESLLGSDAWEQHVDALVQRITPYHRDASAQGARLKQRIRLRHASIAEQLERR